MKHLLILHWSAALVHLDSSPIRSTSSLTRNHTFTLMCKGTCYHEGNTQMNACHQTPIVKIKTKRKPFVFHPVCLRAKQSILLMSACSKVAEKSSESAVIITIIMLLRGSIVLPFTQSHVAGSPPQACAFITNMNGRGGT